MIQRAEVLEAQIHDLKSMIKKMPPGNLSIARNGKNYKWYHMLGGKAIYLPKKERKLAQQLAHKKYLSHTLEHKVQEKQAIQFYLNHYKTPNKIEKMLSCPEFLELLGSNFKIQTKNLDEWLREEYEQNQQHPENLIHKSCSGNTLRSKSEAIIDMMLFMSKIPFRYECALALGEMIIYPDFTIKHPKTGELYYWEHFGMMDKSDYSKNAFSKLQLYIDHKIIPTKNLIITFETKDCPLTPEHVEKVIQYYFG
nr:ATPase [Lachnospiraceae bacterium]